jgi:hypothetical protein
VNRLKHRRRYHLYIMAASASNQNACKCCLARGQHELLVRWKGMATAEGRTASPVGRDVMWGIRYSRRQNKRDAEPGTTEDESAAN